jgi:hypothetical protein
VVATSAAAPITIAVPIFFMSASSWSGAAYAARIQDSVDDVDAVVGFDGGEEGLERPATLALSTISRGMSCSAPFRLRFRAVGRRPAIADGLLGFCIDYVQVL